MTIRVYVPSLGRADQRLLKGPAMQFPNTVEVYYVVPVKELGSYARALTEYGVPARLLACPEKGIAMTRLWIGKHAHADGLTKFLMCDDDVGFLVRQAPDHFRLIGTGVSNTLEMLDWIEEKLEKYQHVAISPREGNNRAGNGGTELVGENTRTLRALAYQTHAFLACEHGRVPVMEDFDVNLQILLSGGQNIVSFYWAQGQRMTNEDGGCSTYRSHELHEASAKKLAMLHPGFVSLREKKNKTDADGFGTRTEVTIQWKAAHKEGQRRARQG